MKLRSTTRTGDIFRVTLADGSARYLQYLGDDSTQLNSEVVRVFKRSFAPDEPADLVEIVNGTVDFHVHTSIKAGMKLGCWLKVGNAPTIGDTPIRFRISEHCGNPAVRFSDKWYVWAVNEELRAVGALDDPLRLLELGPIYPPYAVLARIQTGDYGFFYPAG